jgi:MoxR-like ATPase
LAPYVLSHRLLLRPEAELQGVTAVSLVESTLAAVPVPVERSAF